MLTQEFSGIIFAQKSAGRVKDSSKLSSTLQHLLTTSEPAIVSRVNLVGSFVPSYLKAGCFRCCKGCIRRLTKENTTWFPVIPFFFSVARASRRHVTWLSPGPIQVQFAWTWGRQEFSQEVEIQSFRHETRNFSTRFLYQMVDKISTCLGSQDGVLTHIHRRRRQAC